MANDREELGSGEQNALRSWGEGWRPPASLRDRTLEALRSRGEIGSAASREPQGRGARASNASTPGARTSNASAPGARASGARTRTARTWISLATAAAILAFLGGLALGERLRGRGAPANQPIGERFVLLLFESSDYQNAATPEGQRDRVSEYAGWAEETARSGRLIAGEKLADDGRWCLMRGEQIEILAPVVDAARGTLAGYFIVGATDYDEAIAIAAGCPHLRYGGTVEVRRIEPT